MTLSKIAAALAFAAAAITVLAADYPAPKQAEWVARDFKFHTGEVMPELKLHYTTIGEPTGQPVLVLHGSGGSAASMLTPAFAGELFDAGHSCLTRQNILSSFRTASVTANRPSPPTA